MQKDVGQEDVEPERFTKAAGRRAPEPRPPARGRKSSIQRRRAEASLEAVARTAGVGIGTLYRHFPTREALFEAVYRHEVQQLADLAKRLKKKERPIEALRQWMHSIVEFVATKNGMSTELALATAEGSDPVSYSADRLTGVGLFVGAGDRGR